MEKLDSNMFLLINLACYLSHNKTHTSVLNIYLQLLQSSSPA